MAVNESYLMWGTVWLAIAAAWAAACLVTVTKLPD